MRILFDHGVPHALRHHLPGHEVRTAKYMGWDKLSNGDLLLAAETEEFEAIMTTDRALVSDQEISGSSMRVLALGPTNWRILQKHIPEIQAALEATTPGRVLRVQFRSEQPR